MATVEKPDFGCARFSEAARIAEMSQRLIEPGLTWRYRPDRVAGLIRDTETEVVVARDGGRVVGFGVMEFHFDSHHAHLVLLAVDPSYRRRGTGETLYRWVEKIARLGGIVEIQLELRADNAGALAFYQGLGFRVRERRHGYYDGRQDALSMTRRVGRVPE